MTFYSSSHQITKHKSGRRFSKKNKHFRVEQRIEISEIFFLEFIDYREILGIQEIRRYFKIVS